MKKMKIAYYIITVFMLGFLSIVYFSRQESDPVTPKIKLSYYNSYSLLADVISKQIDQDQNQKNYYWIGVEPGNRNHLQLAKRIKEFLEKEKSFDLVILDQELQLAKEEQNFFNPTQLSLVKENWDKLAKLINENKEKSILVITAAIYSTNLLEKNPLYKIKEVTQRNPITLSMAYFPILTEDEKNSVFQCLTDDKEGVTAWGCQTMNKARSQRRKINFKVMQDNPDTIASTVDLTGPQDYMILVR